MKKKIFLVLLLLLSFGCSTPHNITTNNNDIYYQVFIRSFADSNNDGIGDFNGLANSLDYLHDLGITAIWMMPFHPSDTHHGYDVIDYYDVNPEYGSFEDFDNLVNKANELNIKLMMDLVINHTSKNNEWFLKANNNDPEYRNFYVWNNNMPFSAFTGDMADLNFENLQVRQEIKKIGSFWLNKGISGFRLDAISHIYDENEHGFSASENLTKNIEVVSEFTSAMQKINPNVFVVSEVFSYNSTYVASYFNAADSAFNFPTSQLILKNVRIPSIAHNMVKEIKSHYSNITTALNDSSIKFVDSPFLSNHDLDRTGSVLNGNLEQLKMAAEILLSLPGNPFIYYGEELGMKGVRSEKAYYQDYGYVWDEGRRLPFLWGDDTITTSWLKDNYNSDVASLSQQRSDDDSLFWTYKKLIAVRRNNIALMHGNDFFEYIDSDFKLAQSYIRTYQNHDQKQAVLVIHNFDKTDYPIKIDYNKIIYSTKPLNNNQIAPYTTAIIEIDWNLALELIK